VQSFDVKQDLSLSVPVMIRDHVQAGSGQPEHRTTVVAFIGAKGIDELLARSGPASVAGDLHDFVTAVQMAAEAHGVCFLGTDIDVSGAKVILTAGAPVRTGTDEESMLLALRDIVATDRAFDVKVGVNRGAVFAGEIGTRSRRTYTVMGDAVNLSARVMSQAGPGEILATQPVLDGSRTLFDVAPVNPFFVKGKKKPITASIIGEPEGARSTIAASELPLIGRDEELHTLLDAWGKAGAGNGQTVEIAAPAGMGKTRLLAEFLERAEVNDLVWAECRLYQASTAYFPFRSLLRKVLGLEDLGRSESAERLILTVERKAPNLVPWVSLIGTAVDVDIPPSDVVRQLDDEFRRIRLEEVVALLLEAVVVTPTLFVIEDSQWMDEASSDLMNKVIAAASSRPWLIVLARRPANTGFVADDEAILSRIELGPLGQQTTRDLIIAATQSNPLRLEQVETLASRGQGNPLFLIELLQALQRSDDVDALPDSVEGLIQARIDTLIPLDRDLLQHLSVLGVGFQSEHAEAVLLQSPSEIVATLNSLGEFLAVDPKGRVQFRHALIHDVAYEGLPFRLRRRLHGQIADSILAEAGGDQDSQSELLSLHFFEAGRWLEAGDFSLKAGAKADVIYANLEAASFYARALTAAKRLGTSSDHEIAAVSEARGEALWRAGLFDESLDAYGVALRASDESVRKSDLMLKRARVRALGGSYSTGLGELTKARRLLASESSKSAQGARARLDSFHAVIRMMQGRSDDALHLAEEALVEAAEAGEQEALARAYTVLDAACLTLGRASQADYLPRALGMYEEMGDLLGVALVTNNMGERAWLEGRLDDAVDLYSKADETNRRAGNDPEAAVARANIGEVLIAQGRVDEAKIILEDASRVLRAHGSDAAVFADIHLARVELETGETEMSIELLSEAVAEATEMGQTEWAHMASIHLADAYARRGDLSEALQLLDEVESQSDEGGDLYGPLLATVRVAVLRDLRRPIEALESALAGLDIARRLIMGREESQLDQIVVDLSRLVGEVPGTSPTNPLPSTT
jgi:class 3 adenylate cyclase/tetratricopeptide (TPR) repeat protein